MTAEHSIEGVTPQTLLRTQQVVRWLVEGYSRPEILQAAAEEWGLAQRTADRLIGLARAEIVAAWQVERPELTAVLLSRSDAVYRAAMACSNYHAAAAALAQQARLAKLG